MLERVKKKYVQLTGNWLDSKHEKKNQLLGTECLIVLEGWIQPNRTGISDEETFYNRPRINDTKWVE